MDCGGKKGKEYAYMRRLREVRVEEGKVGRLRGYQEVKGEEGEGLKWMAELEFHKRKSLRH